MAKEAENNGGLEEVLSGFKFGLSVWGEYFNHLTEFVTEVKNPINHKGTKGTKKDKSKRLFFKKSITLGFN